jgi:hypothetical protein
MGLEGIPTYTQFLSRRLYASQTSHSGTDQKANAANERAPSLSRDSPLRLATSASASKM